MDFFCLVGGGLKAGYAPKRLLRSLPAVQRRQLANRVVLILTANRHYALRGVRGGTRFAAASARFRHRSRVRIGRSVWYVVHGRAANAVLQVRHGVIAEVGIANKRLTSSRVRIRRLLASLS